MRALDYRDHLHKTVINAVGVWRRVSITFKTNNILASHHKTDASKNDKSTPAHSFGLICMIAVLCLNYSCFSLCICD